MKAWARVVAALVAVPLLLVSAVTAVADDDPEPTKWPQVVQPDANGEDDPEPPKWPAPENL
ncbi:hypothetical protein GCM10009789_18120 [Kribbella sancticallisti]|uniref:Uncharacterized protein n=1 Tax=Kribbella sancticallisti TaxID=460087 RepID=A0ABP4NNW6_9ACTN